MKALLNTLKLGGATILAVVGVAIFAGSAPRDAQAAISLPCTTSVFATIEYLKCGSADWAAGYGPTTGYFWIETITYTRTFSLAPWVFVSRKFEWRWRYSNGSDVQTYCVLYDAWGTQKKCA